MRLRADRLLRQLLIIQRRGHVTAVELADELEVSVRTVYRDWYALRVAGVPLITDSGPGGGARLYGEWRTELTGLTSAELESLTLLALANPLPPADPSLLTALAKLGTALPPEQQVSGGKLHLDTSGAPTHLLALIKALHNERYVEITAERAFQTQVSIRLRPLGLVSQSTSWFLVSMQEDDRMRVDALSAVLDARLLDAPFARPGDFDLAEFWNRHAAATRSAHKNYIATVDAGADVVAHLERRFGENLTVQPDGVRIAFDDVAQARAELLRWGGAVRIISPEALRRTVVDFAEQIVGKYPSA